MAVALTFLKPLATPASKLERKAARVGHLCPRHESRGWQRQRCRQLPVREPCLLLPVPPQPAKSCTVQAAGTAARCPVLGKTYRVMTGAGAKNQYCVKVIFLRNNYQSRIPRKSSSGSLCTFEDNFLVLI